MLNDILLPSALTGCQSPSQETAPAASEASETTAAQQTDPEAATSTVQTESETLSQTNVDLKALTDLVGKADSEVTALWAREKKCKTGMDFFWSAATRFLF